jgi:hypothetical protein
LRSSRRAASCWRWNPQSAARRAGCRDWGIDVGDARKHHWHHLGDGQQLVGLHAPTILLFEFAQQALCGAKRPLNPESDFNALGRYRIASYTLYCIPQARLLAFREQHGLSILRP